jgi:hypothetical protein
LIFHDFTTPRKRTSIGPPDQAMWTMSPSWTTCGMPKRLRSRPSAGRNDPPTRTDGSSPKYCGTVYASIRNLSKLDRRASPRLGPITDAGEQRDGRATEEAPTIDDRGVLPGVLARECVQQLALLQGEHRGYLLDVRRQAEVTPQTTKKVFESVERHRAPL